MSSRTSASTATTPRTMSRAPNRTARLPWVMRNGPTEINEGWPAAVQSGAAVTTTATDAGCRPETAPATRRCTSDSLSGNGHPGPELDENASLGRHARLGVGRERVGLGEHEVDPRADRAVDGLERTLDVVAEGLEETGPLFRGAGNQAGLTVHLGQAAPLGAGQAQVAHQLDGAADVRHGWSR